MPDINHITDRVKKVIAAKKNWPHPPQAPAEQILLRYVLAEAPLRFSTAALRLLADELNEEFSAENLTLQRTDTVACVDVAEVRDLVAEKLPP